MLVVLENECLNVCMIDGYYPSNPSDYLRVELELRKRRNPQYSIRAFARDLSLSPSHLCEFLSGKAALSVKKVHEISVQLKLKDDQQEHWADLVELQGKSANQKAKIRVSKRLKANKSQVPLEVFRTIADWYHFALLACFEVNPEFSMKELGERLRITEDQVKEAVKRLMKVGLLEKHGSGYKPSTNTNFTGDNDPSEAIRESQRQVLVKTAEALDSIPMNERVNQSLFFSIPEKNVKPLHEALKKRVLETLSEFSSAEAAPDEAIQTLTWHMFPLKGEEN